MSNSMDTIPIGTGQYRVTLTPLMAASLLAKNQANNRQISRMHVEAITADILAGRWQYNGQPICIASNGALLNGQHRCLAVVESQKPIDVLVVYGLPPETFATIDANQRTRSAADVMHIAGCTNTRTLAAVARLRTRWSEDDGLYGNGKNATSAELLELQRHDPSLAAAVEWTHATKDRSKVAPPSVTAFAYWLFARLDKAMAEKFIDAVASGEMLKSGTPTHTLFRKLQDCKATRLYTSHDDKLAYFIKAWNAARRGNELLFLRLTIDERFPRPV